MQEAFFFTTKQRKNVINKIQKKEGWFIFYSYFGE